MRYAYNRVSKSELNKLAVAVDELEEIADELENFEMFERFESLNEKKKRSRKLESRKEWR